MKIRQLLGNLRYWTITNVLVFIYSIPVKAKIIFGRKRGLFLDCGSNLGQGFSFFRRYYPISCFDYDLFEPNPNCHPLLSDMVSRVRSGRIDLHRKAVGTSSGAAKFYGTSDNEGGLLSEGGSILKAHNSSMYAAREENALEVEMIDFVSFIESKLSDYDHIVIKMDIESSEYSVIQDMIDRGTFHHVDTFFVEFHSRYMTEPDRTAYAELERHFVSQISKTRCRLHIWH